MKKLTRHRKIILENMQSRKDHPTAKMVYDSVRESVNSLSFATVYNSLEYLFNNGYIKKLDSFSELAEITLHPRFCNYLHVPMQSGSSKILKLMKRSYTAETFYKRISLVKQKNPNLFIGTDIITGFPVESNLEFSESLQLARDLEIAKIHSFPFSVRKGTTAELLKDDVSKEEKKERVKLLNDLSKEQYKKFGEKLLGQSREAILEGDGTCLTDDYIKLRLADTTKFTTGQFLNLKIGSYEEPNSVLKEGHFLGIL